MIADFFRRFWALPLLEKLANIGIFIIGFVVGWNLVTLVTG